MRPSLQVLPTDIIPQVIDEALQLLLSPGIKVGSLEAIDLLHSSGAIVDQIDGVVQLPEEAVLNALKSVPREFSLFNSLGEPVVQYAGDQVHFNPGSSGIHMLDSETMEHRPSQTSDLIQIVQIADVLSEYDAQSTAVICHDVPEEIGDLYRLYLVLLYSEKPIVTGAFSIETSQVMFDLLNISAGNPQEAVDKPRAIFDVCPSPPLNWTKFASQNLVDLARANIPAQIVSMPLTGAAAPITLIGSIVQHAAECLSGITIHQLANPGAPLVWGGAPAQFDMRHGTTSVGAIETTLIINGYAQVGKSLGLPTHAYLSATDSKVIDTQAGMESGTSAILGTLSGINMISGAGMLDFLASQSLEKLVIDAEAIAIARRYTQGIQIRNSSLSLEHFEDFKFPGNFLKNKLTRQMFRKEQYMPSAVIDRGSLRAWREKGRNSTFDRAKMRVKEILSTYQRPEIPVDKERELNQLVSDVARKAGMNQLPERFRE
jgi:trimethylamine--corrinoid protein Co-methyltransferase